ncbi:bifunctional nuclease family protein [Luteolibacter sp. AS25]|uniref:bifunctional nuclease family protein n=1 Tax=Luteolibacter sp. AS25 TaxID=3135776 RepID=UPI00398A6EB4
MKKAIPVEIMALIPTQTGCAVFLGNSLKTILFYIDPAIGLSINAAMTEQPMPRPLAHDLYMMTLQGFGAEVSRIVINKVDGDVFFARIFITAQNEIMERKIVEIDARPSDSLAIAARAKAPILVAAEVWDQLEDKQSLLEKMQSKSGSAGFEDLDE